MALAHAGERMVILTLPTGAYILGAGLAVALTALVAAFAPWLPEARSRRLLSWRDPLPPRLLSHVSCALLFLLIGVGFLGSRDPLENLLPLVIWTLLWVGMTAACGLYGELWTPINPWTGPVHLARRLLRRDGSIGLVRLGSLPAVLGLLGFAWFQLVSPAPSDPAILARTVLIYWLAIFLLAVLEGPDWPRTGEALTLFFRLISLPAPLRIDRDGTRRTLILGYPGFRLLDTPPLAPGAIAFATLVLATLTFDGLRETFWWLARVGINPLEFPGRSAVMGINTLGLLGTWAATTGAILLAVAMGRRIDGATGPFWPEAGSVLLAFLPIASAYHLAHYLVTFLGSGQYLVASLNDPLERGWNLFGLPEHWVSFGFLADRTAVLAIWNTQFAILLGAHLLAVIVGAKQAAQRTPPLSRWAQLPLILLMVGYTILGLWLLSTPAGA